MSYILAYLSDMEFHYILFLAGCLFSVSFGLRKRFPVMLACALVLLHIFCFAVCPYLYGTLSTPEGFVELMSFHLLNFAVNFIALMLIFDEPVVKILFSAVAAYMCQDVTNCIGVLLQDAAALPYLGGSWFNLAVRIILHLIVFIAVYFAFARKVKRNPDIARNTEVVLAAFAIMVHVMFSRYAGLVTELDVAETLRLALSLAMFVLLFGTWKASKLSNEIQMMKLMREKELAQYEFSKALIDNINIKYHDLNKLVSQLDTGMLPETGVLREFKEEVASYSNVLQTGNKVLDIILTEKTYACKRDDIDFECIIEGSLLDFMSEMDIYSLFNNILTNAIEAVQANAGGNIRYVSLIIKRQGKFISIHEENPCTGKVTLKDDLPVTTKLDKTSHGFGSKSIKQICDKYNGNLNISVTEDNIFNIDLLFSMPT